jgi:hypothetical protein
MMNHTVEQRARVVVLFVGMKSVTGKQSRFTSIFPTFWAPARNTVLRLVRKVEEAESVKKEKHPRNPNVRCPVAVEALPVAIQHSPGK